MKNLRKIYFNNAASSFPKAPGTAEAVYDSLINFPNHQGRSGLKDSNPLDDCRSLIAQMLDIKKKERIIFYPNSTFAINQAIWGFNFKEGDTIITSAAEHNSVLRPLHHLAKKLNVNIFVIPVDREGRIIFSKFKDLVLNKKPVMTVLSHASNVTGAVLDVAPLFEISKKAGAVALLDASQSFGAFDFKADDVNADLIAFTGHKCLHGPPGTGGLYISENVHLEPLVTGGTGVRSDLKFQPPEMPNKFESGTQNEPAFSGLAAAAKWRIKLQNFYEDRVSFLTEKLKEEMNKIKGVNLIKVQGKQVGVTSFTLDGWPSDEAGFILSESFGIICRSGLHCAPLIHKYIGSSPFGTIRFSLSPFNDEEEVGYAVDSIKTMMKSNKLAVV